MVESEANKVDPMEVKGCSGERDGTNGVIVESTHRGRMESQESVLVIGHGRSKFGGRGLLHPGV